MDLKCAYCGYDLGVAPTRVIKRNTEYRFFELVVGWHAFCATEDPLTKKDLDIETIKEIRERGKYRVSIKESMGKRLFYHTEIPPTLEKKR